MTEKSKNKKRRSKKRRRKIEDVSQKEMKKDSEKATE